MSSVDTNKELVREFYEGDFIRGDASNVEKYFAPDFVDHDPPGPQIPSGRPGVRAVMEMLAGAFPERRIEIHDLVGENDKVVLRFTIHGKHEGVFIGRRGTGGDIQLKIIAILRIKDGKIEERWGRVETVGFSAA